MSLSENLYNLGALMKTNLEEKGIDGLTGNEGLTTLANKILDVEPSVAGLELSTSIDCNVSSNKILLGQSVVFSATLSVSYDDTSIEDIDISGVLTGATVLFKTSDGTIIGSGVTDVNGVATYTHTIEEIGNITVYSEFEGSTNFSSCISSTTVTVECSYNFEVTVDKKILSANDNDIATFNCILSDGTGVIVGESIDYQILHNDTILDEGTLTTDNTGKITLEYAATGVGNVDVVFSLRSILQETYGIEDCMKYYPLIDNSDESAFTIPSGLVSSYSSDGWNISATNYSMVKLTDKLTNDCSVEFTLEDYNKLPRGDSVLVYQYSNGETMPNQEIITSGNTDNFPLILGQRMNHDLIRGAKYKIEYTSSTIKVYENNILLASASNTVGFPTRFEWHMGSGGRYAVYKDLKVKAL